MKNNHDFFGLTVNILIVVLVLGFIVVGLNVIGIYDLPKPIEKLLGTADSSEDTPMSGNHGEHNLVDFAEHGKVIVETAEVSYENARRLLENVAPIESYAQEITADYFSNGDVLYSQYISVTRNDGNYSAVVTNENDDVILRITQDPSQVYLSKILDGNMKEITLPKGNFDISDECGFILTADNFLSSDYVLDEASFSVGSGNFGSELSITFESTMHDYKQTEIYTLSLDFGVVISAVCKEGDEIVYTMKTDSLYFVN